MSIKGTEALPLAGVFLAIALVAALPGFASIAAGGDTRLSLEGFPVAVCIG